MSSVSEPGYGLGFHHGHIAALKLHLPDCPLCGKLAPLAVREQDARDYPDAEPCPRCGRRQGAADEHRC